MWKKFALCSVFVILILVVLYGLKYYFTPSDEPLDQNTPVENVVFSYDVSSLSQTCQSQSAMICAVEKAVKCTLNPDFDGCREARLPKFIFMNDESLGRPTKMSFQTVKVKPLSSDLVEIHTRSTCDGNWFGLCQGYVIYVLVPTSKEGEEWRVKDIYAMTE